MTAPRARGLQRELQLRLMTPVLVIVLVAGLLGVEGARRLVDRVYDRWLLDAAASLAGQVQFESGKARIELTPQSRSLLLYDVVDKVHFEVLQDGQHLLGDFGLPQTGAGEAGQGGAERTYDARYAGRQVRVASVPVAGPAGARAIVLVAETSIKRHRTRRDLLLMLLPIAALPLLAALVIGLAVRSTVRPLERIAARWNERSHASLQPLPSGEVPNELQPFAAALNDLLDRMRSMLERERHMAANAAHQLRTPLAGLQLGLARAAEAPDLASTRAILNEMGRTTQRTARLVQQLLSLGRLDPELRVGLTLEAVDLVPLAREVGESFLDAALDKAVDLELSSDVEHAIVQGQADLLSDVLGNLIDNAIRYTPAGGKVQIAVRMENDGSVLEVADSGPGIPEAERERVLERFYRGTSGGDGSGLGLAIVKEIAELHGAQVSIAASSLGGARVSIRFVAAPDC